MNKTNLLLVILIAMVASMGVYLKVSLDQQRETNIKIWEVMVEAGVYKVPVYHLDIDKVRETKESEE